MKHDLKITLMLIALFLAAQLVGLSLLSAAVIESVDIDGNKVVSFDEEKIGEVPYMSGPIFLLYIGLGIAIGTGLVLLLAKFKKGNLWRAWFFLAVFVAMNFALKTFLPSTVALVLSLGLAAWKIFRPNVVVHNLTEVLMYSGIAIFLVPLLNSAENQAILGIPGNIFWAAIVLIIISVYDFIAVFRTKHMVSMAQFQTESKVFAGLFIPYEAKVSAGKRVEEKVVLNTSKAPKEFNTVQTPKSDFVEKRNAVLGGGDIAFPLIFIGTVFYYLTGFMTKQAAFLESSIIIATTTIALALLFFFAKKGKFYPAMPIISAGCFVGYILTLLI
jgi:presenilin-like A22 family membrane protease